MKWDLADLVSPADIAEQFGVGKPAVSNWIARYPDFPRPLTTVAQGTTSLFSRKAVIDWHARKWSGTAQDRGGPEAGAACHSMPAASTPPPVTSTSRLTTS